MMRAPDAVTTQRLTGRRIQAADFPYLRSVDADLRIQKTLFGEVQTEEQSRARLLRWLEMWEGGLGFWIFSDAAGVDIGHAGLFPSPRKAGEVEVGYVVKPEHWGCGFATEMATASLRVGFEQLGLDRIVAIAQISNDSSRRIMEKCGMTFEAELPSPDGIPGVLYALSRASFSSR